MVEPDDDRRQAAARYRPKPSPSRRAGRPTPARPPSAKAHTFCAWTEASQTVIGRARAAQREVLPRLESPQAGPIAQASGSSLTNGMLSHRLPAATMQLRPCGEVLTTVQVPLSSDA